MMHGNSNIKLIWNTITSGDTSCFLHDPHTKWQNSIL